MPGFVLILDTNYGMRAANANGYWGLARPSDGNTTDWIRTTQNGLLPYSAGKPGVGSLGTDSWRFRDAHIQNIYGQSIQKQGKIVTGYKIIYNNDSNSASANVTLSETAANFAFLDIYTKSNDSYYTSTRVHAPNGKIVFLTNGWYPGSGTIKAQLKLRTVKISGTSIANNNSVQTSWGNDGLNRNNVVSIVRVDGWV